MAGHARIDVKREDTRSLVTIAGVIDESFDRAFLKELTPGGAIILNLKAVSRINSMGMMLWCSLMRELGTISGTIYVQDCSPMMVAQTSTVFGFMGRAVILTVCVPYLCEHCDREQEAVFKTTDLQLANAPACEKCGRPTALNDTPELYMSIPAGNLPTAQHR